MDIFPAYRLSKFQQEFGPRADFNMSASAPAPLTLEALLSRASDDERVCWERLSLGYAASAGGDYLREHIAALYPGLEAKHIVTFAGAQEAIFSVYHALLSRGDRLHVIRPLFEPLEIVGVGIGAEISAVGLQLDANNQWQLDLDAWLDGLGTKSTLAAINFPHNPTGMMVSLAQQQSMVSACEKTDSWLFSDEVFRGLEHENETKLPAVATLYDKGISMGVVSKMFGLGGVRVGWVACRNRALLKSLTEIKAFLSICNGQTDELLAAIALRNAAGLQTDIVEKLKSNLHMVQSVCLENEMASKMEWLNPQAGCVAYPRLQSGHDAESFAHQLVRDNGVLVVPGCCFLAGEAHFRVGLGGADFPHVFSLFKEYLSQC